MAKVYDALKRVEKERAEQAAVPAAPPAVAPPAALPKGPAIGRMAAVWRRWFRSRRRPPLVPVRPAVDAAFAERVEALASQLQALDQRTARTIPSAENLIQLMRARLESFEADLGAVTSRVEEIEPAVAARVAGATREIDQRVARLQTRVSVLMAVVGALLVAVLFRL